MIEIDKVRWKKELGYHNKINVNYLLDYPNKNNISSELLNLEEIVANINKNLIKKEVDDDIIVLELIMYKKILKALTTLHNFLL